MHFVLRANLSSEWPGVAENCGWSGLFPTYSSKFCVKCTSVQSKVPSSVVTFHYAESQTRRYKNIILMGLLRNYKITVEQYVSELKFIVMKNICKLRRAIFGCAEENCLKMIICNENVHEGL